MEQDLGASGMKLNSKWNKNTGGEIDLTGELG